MIKHKGYINTKWENFRYKLLLPYGIRQIKKYGFWFIDIPRTSSTSIRVELGKEYSMVYGKSDVFEKGFKQIQIIPDHIPAIKMQEIMGKKEWEKLFTFTFVRNPWDRMVSFYHYRLKSKLLRPDMDFREFILRLKSSKFGEIGTYNFYGHYFGSSDFVSDRNNNIIVDFIGKYENRQKDIQYIANKIGSKELGKIAIQKATPAKKHYSDYYDDETKMIIEKVYHKDIELFGYKFERKEY